MTEADSGVKMDENAHSGRVLRSLFECCVRALFRIYVRLHVTDGERLPSQPFLLCSNHGSHLDGVALMVAAGLPFESFRLLAASDYFDPRSVTGRLTRGVLNIVGIDRSDRQAIRLRHTISECRELVRTQQVRLIAFPEGTRSTTGQLLPFKRGSGILAVALGLPVVPAYIEGTGHAMPKGSWIPRPAPVRVLFGRPIVPGEWALIHGQKARSDYVISEIERRIADLARAAVGDGTN
jgi:1-acyl-sn-glycerol-3-phosphate acyltransferase/long-chain acyl-CoA synthetase